MRVAHIITRLIIGGAQENTILNCQDLIREYQDDVVLITGPGLGPEGSLEDDARRRSIPLQVLHEFRRNIHPLRDMKAYLAVQRAIADFRPDVVHTHSGKAGLLGRVAAHRLGVRAIVHTVHGAPFHEYQSRPARALFRQCEKYATRRCHAIISVADAMTDRLVAAGIAPRTMFTTIYSGMEIEPLLQASAHRARMREELGLGSDDIVVGKVARLFHLKGHEDVIDAARIAVESEPRLHFLLVGDGILRESLAEKIAAAGLSPRFHFTGLVPPERVAALLSAMDIVVHASYREGLARVLPQAMLAGRAVISYDVDGAREVVDDGQTGFLVAVADVRGMAERIVQLAASAELRERLAEEGQRRCQATFPHAVMTRQIRDVYLRILGE